MDQLEMLRLLYIVDENFKGSEILRALLVGTLT